MAPSLEPTSTATALEARETRFYYSNGHCGDKNIYMCEPGIIYGIIGAILLGLGIATYVCYHYRKTVSPCSVHLMILLPWHHYYLIAKRISSSCSFS